eukprot:tig00001208_g7532.t1
MDTHRTERSRAAQDEEEKRPGHEYEALMASLRPVKHTPVANLEPSETLTPGRKASLIRQLKAEHAKESVWEEIDTFEGKMGSKLSTTEGHSFMDRTKREVAELESMGIRSGWLRNWAQQTYTNLLSDDYPLPHKRVENVLKNYQHAPTARTSSRPGSAASQRPSAEAAGEPSARSSAAWASAREPQPPSERWARGEGRAMTAREPPRPSVHHAHRRPPSEGSMTERRPASGSSSLRTGATTLDRAFCNDYNAVQLRLAQHPRDFSTALTRDRDFGSTEEGRERERLRREELNKCEVEALTEARAKRRQSLASKAEETRAKHRERAAARRQQQLALGEPAFVQRAQQREREQEDRRTLEAAAAGDAIIFPSHFQTLSPAGRKRAVAAGALPPGPIPAHGPLVPQGSLVTAALSSSAANQSQALSATGGGGGGSNPSPRSSTGPGGEPPQRAPAEMVDLDLFERRLTRLVARRQGAEAAGAPPVTVGTTPRSQRSTGPLSGRVGH